MTKDNLDAANSRFMKETNIIEEATLNLEVARIEKENADQAVEDYLKETASILPFAAAPGEKGFETLG